MANLIYNTGSAARNSLSGTQYENPSYGTMRLNIRTGTGANDVAKYGFTSDVSASQYCKMRFRVNGRECFIGKNDFVQSSIYSTVTSSYYTYTATYTTTTRSSLSTSLSYNTTTTSRSTTSSTSTRTNANQFAATARCSTTGSILRGGQISFYTYSQTAVGAAWRTQSSYLTNLSSVGYYEPLVGNKSRNTISSSNFSTTTHETVLYGNDHEYLFKNQFLWMFKSTSITTSSAGYVTSYSVYATTTIACTSSVTSAPSGNTTSWRKTVSSYTVSAKYTGRYTRSSTTGSTTCSTTTRTTSTTRTQTKSSTLYSSATKTSTHTPWYSSRTSTYQQTTFTSSGRNNFNL